MTLNKIITLRGTMTAESGITVKGGNDTIHMGGADSEVIRNSITGEPYIPGSSLKGKMRSMLEKVYGLVTVSEKSPIGNPCRCGLKTCMVCTLFGAHMNPEAKSGQRRMYVHDITINKEFMAGMVEDGKASNITEVKTSNCIDRLTGMASSRAGVRKIERISAGTQFDYSISIEVFSGDDEKRFKSTVEEALKLVESTGLGAGTSTGSGKVNFNLKKALWEETKFGK